MPGLGPSSARASSNCFVGQDFVDAQRHFNKDETIYGKWFPDNVHFCNPSSHQNSTLQRKMMTWITEFMMTEPKKVNI